MFIEPMQGMEAIGSIGSTLPVGNTERKDENSGMFLSIFEDSIGNVLETEAAVNADTVALATGEVDDLHTLGINQAKAQLSISMLISLRNGFLDAYNELMRISL